MIYYIRDKFGELRKCGSLIVPRNFVSSLPVFEENFPLWDDADIRKAITDPNRRVSRKLFSDSWICDQKQYGSCNGWAAASALSRARYLRGIQDNLVLSGSYVYSKINRGQDQGSILEDGLKAIQTYGAPPASLVTAEMIYPHLQPGNADKEASKRKGMEAYAAKTKQGWRTGLAAGFIGVAAVHVGANFQNLRGGVCGLDYGMGNHAVCIDDLVIKNGTELYDMANSWSARFGEGGRGYLTWDHFAQTFGYHMFYLIRSTEEKDFKEDRVSVEHES